MQFFLRFVPLALFVVAGCTHAPSAPVVTQAVDTRALEIEARQDDLLRQLAQCESGGNGPSDRPIVGGRGAYFGRFQFSPRTVIAFVRERDGRDLSTGQAIALAHDYEQAMALAEYVIFERDGVHHWPACNRKLGLSREVAAIKSLQ
jgi:hypothetical protein